VRRKESRVPGDIALGHDFNHISADKVDALEAAQEFERLSGCKPADTRCARPRRKDRIDAVDVVRKVHAVFADAIKDSTATNTHFDDAVLRPTISDVLTRAQLGPRP